MRGKEITVGMKVVPVIKTIEGPLGASKEWERAQAKGQAFLYVIRVNDAQKVFICSADKGAKVGEKFAAIDLRATDWGGWASRAPGFVHQPKDPKAAAERLKTREAAKATKAKEREKAAKQRAADKAAKQKEKDKAARLKDAEKLRTSQAKAKAAAKPKAAKPKAKVAGPKVPADVQEFVQGEAA